MQILIRGVHTKVSDPVKKYLRKKILKYEMVIPRSAAVECTFEAKGGPRRDGNKILHLQTRLEGARKGVFIKSKALPDFIAAIDVVDDKLDRVVQKHQDLKKYKNKRHKYYFAKVKQIPSSVWSKVTKRR